MLLYAKWVIPNLGTTSIFKLPLKLPVLGGWVSGLAVSTWQFEYFPKKRTQIMITHKHHDHTPQIYNITLNCNTQQSRHLTT